MNDDAALLRRYADDGSESAFTTLVQRHVDLVYGAALRRTGGDAHRAADVAQQVFTTLAQQARKISVHPALAAWLHTATRNAALNLMISEQRQKQRELAAAALEPELVARTAETSPVWERVRPFLDAAIDDLPEADRGAVVLRFLEQRPFAEIAATLRVSEDAARMRTDRALEKLRGVLARRGIDSPAAALGAMVATHSALSAPAGLAASFATSALAAAGGGAVAAGTGLAFFMSLKTITAVAATVAAFGAGAYLGFSSATHAPLPPPPETPEHTRTIAALRQEKLNLRAEVDRLTAANAALNVKLTAQPPPRPAATVPAAQPIPRGVAEIQKATLNNLRQIAAARDQFLLENGRPPASMDELVGETKYIRRLNPVDGETYSGLGLGQGQPLTVVTANGIAVTYDPSGNATTRPEPSTGIPASVLQIAAQRLGPDRAQRIQATSQTAIAAYRAANNGQPPKNPEALIPYFATPQDGADFVEFLEIAKTAR